MRYLILLSLAACGQGVGIIKHGHVVDEDLVRAAFYNDEIAHRQVLNEAVSYYDLAEENDLTIEYVNSLYFEGKEYTGLTFNNDTIKIEFSDTGDSFVDCVHNYAILAHELLHFACVKGAYGICNPSENFHHTVPFVFLEWAIQEGVSYDQTIEFLATESFLQRDCR